MSERCLEGGCNRSIRDRSIWNFGQVKMGQVKSGHIKSEVVKRCLRVVWKVGVTGPFGTGTGQFGILDRSKWDRSSWD